MSEWGFNARKQKRKEKVFVKKKFSAKRFDRKVRRHLTENKIAEQQNFFVVISSGRHR